MDARNCIKCKQIFNYVSSPFCPLCAKEEDRLYNEVRDYIKDNPNCTMAMVVEAVGVSMKRLLRYIKEGGIEISQGMYGELSCEACGAKIKKGKFCDACVIKISQEINATTTKKPAAVMHTWRNK